MGPGFDGDAEGEFAVGGFVVGGFGGLADGEELKALAVHHQFDLMFFGEAFDAFVAVAGEAELDEVFAIDGEVVVEDGSAAGASGEVGEEVLLGQVGRGDEDVAAGGAGRVTDGEAGDAGGGREVAFEEGGGEFADGDVIETVAGFVFREERRDVEIDGQEVPDGVVVFGAGEAAEGVGTTGVGFGGGSFIESGFQRGDGGVVGSFVGVGGTGGRHVADAHLADDFFPRFGICGYVVGGERGEAQAAGFGLGAVAGEAVAVDSGGGRDGGRGWVLRQKRGGREKEDGKDRNAAHQPYRI